MLLHCMAFRNLTPCFRPTSRSASRSRAVWSSSLYCRATCAEPSLTISSRQVSGLRRALARASPFRENGLGLPRLTSRKAAWLVRKGRSLGASAMEKPPFRRLLVPHSPRSHAPRGNACRDAPRRDSRRRLNTSATLPARDAERTGLAFPRGAWEREGGYFNSLKRSEEHTSELQS